MKSRTNVGGINIVSIFFLKILQNSLRSFDVFIYILLYPLKYWTAINSDIF